MNYEETKIDDIIFGTRIADVHILGFNELSISNETMKADGNSPVRIHSDVMREDCMQLLNDWLKQTPAKTY